MVGLDDDVYFARMEALEQRLKRLEEKPDTPVTREEIAEVEEMIDELKEEEKPAEQQEETTEEEKPEEKKEEKEEEEKEDGGSTQEDERDGRGISGETDRMADEESGGEETAILIAVEPEPERSERAKSRLRLARGRRTRRE